MNMLKKIVRRMRGGHKNEHMVLQEYFFREALKEIGISNGRVEIDHMNGTCWHKNVGTVPLVFPEDRIEKVRLFSRRKTQNYIFRGMISPGREWLDEYPNVNESNYGRDPSRKYELDNDYFEGLSASKFGLAPVGDCPWSYRFFEAIMCEAIPIIGQSDYDIFSPHFNFQRHGEKHLYDEDQCRENYKIFIAKHTLRGISIGQSDSFDKVYDQSAS